MSTERRVWVEQVMGLPVSLHVRGATGDPDAAVAAAFGLLHSADRMFSTYRADSQVSRINRGELLLPDADPTVREVARLCATASRLTGGWFDAHLPGPDGRPWFDPSGLVKGWAAQRAADRLTAGGVGDFCLNAGGDVVLRRGPGRPAWRVGVEDPAHPDRLLTVLELGTGAVATSGTGRRGAHVVDPHTGLPATRLSSVTVTGPSLVWADVYATAALARGARPNDLPDGYRCPVAVTAATGPPDPPARR